MKKVGFIQINPNVFLDTGDIEFVFLRAHMNPTMRTFLREGRARKLVTQVTYKGGPWLTGIVLKSGKIFLSPYPPHDLLRIIYPGEKKLFPQEAQRNDYKKEYRAIKQRIAFQTSKNKSKNGARGRPGNSQRWMEFVRSQRKAILKKRHDHNLPSTLYHQTHQTNQGTPVRDHSEE